MSNSMLRLALIAGVVLTMTPEVLAENVEQLYVAPGGNDAWSGGLNAPNAAETDGPFATVRRARDAIRALKKDAGLPSGGIEVQIQEGVYLLDRAFELSAEDSGTAEAPIVYSALPGGEVRLLGGKIVTSFTQVTDAATLARLDESARGHVLEADLTKLGLTDFGSPEGGGLELFFGGDPMTLARWPNEDFVRIVDIVVQDGHEIHGRHGSKVGKFIYEGERPSRWVGEKDPWLHGYWFWDWSDQRQRIESIDPDTQEIDIAPPYHGYGYRKGQWYYAFNLLVELDAPGEWYLDRETGMLYFWPPAPIESGEVMVSVIPTLISMKEVSHVTLRGLTLEAARATALTLSGGIGDRIAGCTFRNIGGDAISVSGGQEHGVVGCDIYQMGGGGISLKGGDRATLTPAGHFADNNHIHDYGRLKRTYRSAISLNGVGNRASHNLIHDAPHMAIGFGGNDHVIEFNEIHDVCTESNDAGAIYAGRNWTMRGNVIRHNYLHDITGFQGKGCVGVYLDDMFCSTLIYGNVFYKVTSAAFIGGGRDCTVENNIFVDCSPALHVDARALGWADYHADEWIEEAREKKTISGIAYTEPPYSERYPRLPGLLEDEPKAPKGNRIVRNIFWGGTWDAIEEKARPYILFEDNLLDEDPRFVDAAGQDFRLDKDSPAFNLGFKAIPVREIGLYPDEHRASWPVARSANE